MFDGRFDEADMILPEGFNPELGDQNFTEDGELADLPVSTPTTDENEVDEEEKAIEELEREHNETITADSTPEVAEVPKTLRVRFNHQDRELTMDEATVFAQKGMNFDKIEAKSKQQQAQLSKYEDMAKMFGFDSAEAMMTQAEQNYVDTRVKDLVDQGNSEAIAKFLVSQEMEKLKATKAAMVPEETEIETQTQPEPTKQGLSEDRKAEIKEFSVAFPGVTKIPDEVFKMHSNGMRLTTAYEIYQNRQALDKAKAELKASQNELAILKQNQAAAARGPVTGTVGMAAPDKQEAEDPFIKGFDLASL